MVVNTRVTAFLFIYCKRDTFNVGDSGCFSTFKHTTIFNCWFLTANGLLKEALTANHHQNRVIDTINHFEVFRSCYILNLITVYFVRNKGTRVYADNQTQLRPVNSKINILWIFFCTILVLCVVWAASSLLPLVLWVCIFNFLKFVFKFLSRQSREGRAECWVACVCVWGDALCRHTAASRVHATSHCVLLRITISCICTAYCSGTDHRTHFLRWFVAWNH